MSGIPEFLREVGVTSIEITPFIPSIGPIRGRLYEKIATKTLEKEISGARTRTYDPPLLTIMDDPKMLAFHEQLLRID